jgi:hypothetical protein
MELMRIGEHGIAAGKLPAAELFGSRQRIVSPITARWGFPRQARCKAGPASALSRAQQAHGDAPARSSAVPERSDARRTNRPERIAARRATGEIANEPATPEGQVKAAVGDGGQLLRRGESDRSRRMQRRVIVRGPAAFRSLAGTRSGSRHAVRLGGNLFRYGLFRSSAAGHKTWPQALHIVAARRIG